MDNLSQELHKLKIDRSERSEQRPPGGRWGLFLVAIIVIAGVIIAFVLLREPGVAATVEVV
ncbi:MAG: hypothetical protein HY646_08910, partial [Acidobacteria bacterium]|nr:hypothetical protein [Acidobacteriota bacterium]